MKKKNTRPIMEDPSVKELIAITEQPYIIKIDTKDFMNMLKYVKEIEEKLTATETNIQGMKKHIDTLEYKADHPIKTVYDQSVVAAQAKLQQTTNSLNTLKNKIIEGSKKAVTAFKNNGAVALNNIMSFFDVKDGFEHLKNNLNDDIKVSKNSIAKIEKVSSEYHEAGKHLKNVGRALIGKETVETAKEQGTLSKTLQAPYKTNVVISSKALKVVESAIGGLERLNAKSAKVKEDKQSVKDLIAENKETIKNTEPPLSKTRNAELSL